MKQFPILSILGPTCSGKTALSYKVLEQFKIKGYDCEIISADSRQVYRYLDIGSAKPSFNELQFTKHHCIDIVAPNELISAGVFVEEADKALKSMQVSNKIPLLVGGAGLYVKAFLSGLFNETPSDERNEIREQIQQVLKEKGKEFLYQELKNVDPKSAEYYLDKNPSRVSRALEYFLVHNTSIIDDFSQKNTAIERASCNFILNPEREILYSRINARTVDMFKQGLLEEVRNVLQMGYTKEDVGLKMIGYFEAIQVFEQDLSQQEAIESIQKRTRNYAKRQVTWFRKEPQNSHFIENSGQHSEEIVEKYLREYEKIRT